MDSSRTTSVPPPGAGRAGVAELFTAARTGDRSAFNELVAALSPLLWHVARTQGLDRQLSQDAVQTTWLWLLRDMHTIRNPQALVGWLITTVKRECWRMRDRHRAEVPTDDPAVLEHTDLTSGPDELAGQADHRRRLWRAVDRLPSRCRELLRIVAFVPRPDYGLIAAMLGMKHGSVGPTRSRCLAKLRGLLGLDGAGASS